MQMVYLKEKMAGESAPECGVVTSAVAIFRRQWRAAATTFVVIACLAALLVALLPRRYDAEMKLLVNNDRPGQVVAAGAVSPPAQSDIDEAQINSEIQLMTSSGLLGKVVNEIAADENSGNPNMTPIKSERAVKRMRRHLHVEAARKSDVIEISYDDRSPERAALVLQRLLAAYLYAHTQARATPGTFQFFKRQVESYQQQLQQIGTQLMNYELKDGVLDLPQQEDLLLKQREETQAALLASAAATRADTSSISQGQAALAATPLRITTDARSTPNQYSIERMNTLLVELKNKQAALLSNFPPSDRQVVDVNKQIAIVTQGLQSAVQDESVEKATGVNPLYQALKTDVDRQRMQLAAEQARHTALQAELAAYDGRLAALTSSKQEYERLQRSQKELEENVLLYSRKQEEARVAEELDRQRFSNVTVLEPPIAFYIPAQPKTVLDLVLGCFLALCLAIVAALVADRYFDGVYEPSTLRELTGLPVMGISAGRSSWR
jgi:uncharacterized protein involved in exopolysaccharide biosynthesis